MKFFTKLKKKKKKSKRIKRYEYLQYFKNFINFHFFVYFQTKNLFEFQCISNEIFYSFKSKRLWGKKI